MTSNHDYPDSHVRPLDGAVDSRPERPPRLTIVVVLLAVGGTLGWGAASLGGQADPSPAPAINESDASPIGISSVTADVESTVSWVEASTVPAMPAGMDYAGFSEAVELNGTTYLVVDYYNAASGGAGSELWSSVDGAVWGSDAVALGEPATSLALTTFGESLLLTGTTDTGMGLWKSLAGRAIDGSSWSRIPLIIPDQLSVERHATVVNDSNKIVTMAIGNFEIFPSIVEPYLPVGVELTQFDYQNDEFVYGIDGSAAIQIFAEPPEVVVASGNVWIRLVTLEGEEVLQTIPLPDGVYPVDATPSLASIPVARVWISEDAIDFLPATGPNALPDGYFLPQAWDDRYITAVYERDDSFAPNENVALWSSHSGRAWRPELLQPPSQCSPFDIAVSGDRIHLTGDDGTQCSLVVDGEWIVLDQPATVAYVIGGDAGFIGYPDSFEYDTALFSQDGVSWTEITIPTREPYPTLLILKERLLALSVNQRRPSVPMEIDLWIGEIGP